MSETKMQWETLDLSNFRVFLRDLSETTDINLKHMIEDSLTSPLALSALSALSPLSATPTPSSLENTKQKKKKNEKPMKKKDIIIRENQKRLYAQEVEKDRKTSAFLLETFDETHPSKNYETLKTDEARTEFKLTLLERYWKKRKEHLKHVLLLYFHLEGVRDRRPELFAKIDKVLDQYEVKGYMLEQMGDMLPPLNDWDKGSYTLDPWQTEVIGYVKQRDSVIVRAPTSAGKTFVAMATGVLHKKVLYVCPAKPVAYQVGANFQKMGYRVHYVVEGVADMSYDKQTNIFVGTPDTIEDYMPKLGAQYDYAVFDEIHQVNEYDLGLCYENIVKMLSCPFLALSATVSNIDYLREIFQRCHPSHTIHYVEYSKRFINQQRWVYTDTLVKIHPLECYEGLGSLSDIHFSPNDCSVMYDCLRDISEDYYEEDGVLEDRIDGLAPDEYFKGHRLLTLDESKRYEEHLKHHFDQLSKTHPEMIRNVVDTYKTEREASLVKETIIPFFKKCKKKELLPMLYFHTEETVSREIFLEVYERLQREETRAYPFHYQILEKKNEYYQSYKDKRETYETGLKIKTKDALSEKASRLEEFDRTEKHAFIQKVSECYEWAKRTCRKQDDENVVTQLKNLDREHGEFLKNPDFRAQDIFKKHPSYCFTNNEPMSGHEIRTIKRQIKAATGITIEYTDPLFQMLKRGIGLYLKSLPDEYNWIVQGLLSRKKLGIVISDRTLCLGIDLPIRSVALTGYKEPRYTTSDYLQMSGRAGRRGKDKQGNILFHGLASSEYLPLMKGTNPQIVGSEKPMYESYNVVRSLNSSLSLENLYDRRFHKGVGPLLTSTITYDDTRFEKLLWHMRIYREGRAFVDSLSKLEKRLFRVVEEEKEGFLLTHISETLYVLEEPVIECYRQNRIEEDIEATLAVVRNVGEIFRQLINHLNPVTYQITLRISRQIFQRCRTLVYKYRLL